MGGLSGTSTIVSAPILLQLDILTSSLIQNPLDDRMDTVSTCVAVRRHAHGCPAGEPAKAFTHVGSFPSGILALRSCFGNYRHDDI